MLRSCLCHTLPAIGHQLFTAHNANEIRVTMDKRNQEENPHGYDR
jgi:hypothetical protein